ncbi:low molecular weight protein-tyrosine-phosphatase [Thaumasiovibrio subtropicus]|uniref:low molecular weight protein-tyrosine-phosphatase n=1 Tax=Thaumasiovibrio subtropicus TaxID=1891207 RepID=UPI000B3565A6|nr:low molecular weight protein-tyrosine-phosphatase [Thaumasiovibrio subtropicus]
MQILVVCMGNICRSPTAEAVLRKAFKTAGREDIVIDSAGTDAYHVGEQPDRRSREAGERRGYDFDGIRARQIAERDYAEFDLILAADKQNYRRLVQQCPDHYRHKVKLMLSYSQGSEEEVPDPYYGGDQGFELVLDLIEEAAEGLLNTI